VLPEPGTYSPIAPGSGWPGATTWTSGLAWAVALLLRAPATTRQVATIRLVNLASKESDSR
jgi:hypothetical protein